MVLKMQSWIKITCILCLFGTLREIRPSEPFVTEFLSGKWRNITTKQLNRDVYPVGTYSYLTQLVLVFLITDFLRFKPVIILSGLSGISVYAVLLWTSSLEWLQVSQFLYGLYMATEVAYLTYIYAKVEPDKYPKVSSYTRIAALTGRFLSGVSSQLLVIYGLMDYRELNYITFSAQILATCWAFLLPAVPYGIYFHRNTAASADSTPIKTPPRSLRTQVSSACVLLSRHARAAYSRGGVTAWSALYAAALALFVQAQTYVQLLWADIQREEGGDAIAYNGAVEAAQTLLGALGALAASWAGPAWAPALAAAVQAVAVFVGAYAGHVVVAYAGYVVMGVLFHYTITVASAKIASQLSDDSCFGLIFGINTLISTGLQSILTLVLIQTLSMSIYMQYYCISVMFLILSVAWLLGWIIQVCRQNRAVSMDNQLYEGEMTSPKKNAVEL